MMMQVRRRTAKHECPLQLTLYVRWFSPNGRTKVTRLLLRPVTSVEALQVCTASTFPYTACSHPEELWHAACSWHAHFDESRAAAWMSRGPKVAISQLRQTLR